MLTFKPAGYADVAELVERGVRLSDWRECLKATGGGMDMALRLAVGLSALSVAVRFEGRIIALFGVAADASGHGVVWLAGHDDMGRSDLAVVLGRASRRFVECWLREFKRLHNVVDPVNKGSQRWLEWLGFTIDRGNPARGPLGHELWKFWREVCA